MADHTPESRKSAERSLLASFASNTRWAFEPDRVTATKPARDKFDERFFAVVDPDNKLPEAERRRRARSLKRAYFQLLAYRSVQARRARAEAKKSL
jgi:hypothetical protein